MYTQDWGSTATVKAASEVLEDFMKPYSANGKFTFKDYAYCIIAK